MKNGCKCPECGMIKEASDEEKIEKMPKGDKRAAFAVKSLLKARTQPKPKPKGKTKIRNMIGDMGKQDI